MVDNIFILLIFILMIPFPHVTGNFGYKSYSVHADSSVINLECSGESEIIRIIKTEVQSNQTKCAINQCILLDSDEQYISEKCEQKQSCEISLLNMSLCLSQRSFLEVQYACRRDVYSCDFEIDTCKLKNEDIDDHWARGQGFAHGSHNIRDHTTGSDSPNFYFVNAGTTNQSLLLERHIQRNVKQCLSFYYWMSMTADTMTVYIYSRIQNSKEINKWVIQNEQNTCIWTRKKLSLKDDGDYYIMIEANGKHENSKFAVDDIVITNTDCDELDDCDFESDLCGWLATGNWDRQHCRSKKSQTGPSTDHSSTSENGFCAYMNASSRFDGARSNLSRHFYNKTGEYCFSLWFYMYGHQMGKLYVYYESETIYSKKLFSEFGNKGQFWHKAQFDIRTEEHFRIIIEGERGNDHRSDIAIDDITLLPGTCEGFITNEHCCDENCSNEGISLTGCYHQYLPLSNVTFEANQNQTGCIDVGKINAEEVCISEGYDTYCNLSSFTQQNSCPYINRLTLEYRCEDSSKSSGDNATTENSKNNDPGEKVPFVGLIGGVGGVLFIGFICTIAYIIYRNRRRNKKHCSQSTSNYTVPSGEVNDEKLVVNSTAQQTNVINTSHKSGDEYTIANRSIVDINGISVTNRVASSIFQNVDDDYAESDAGVYDISGHNRHKFKDTIYDHSMEDMYDITNHGRKLNTEEDTYDHMLGEQIGNEYDVAGS